jgi:hypothetical protein
LELAELLPWIIAVAAVIIIALVVLAVLKRRKRKERSDRLRERLGPEYDRTVDRANSRSEAEDQLEARLERRERMRLRHLEPGERSSFLARWEDLQASFVDGPSSAVRGADVLLDDVALARGYPDASADQRLDDLAMDHSDEVHEYRQANRGDKGGDGDGERRALLAARGLFEAMIGPEHETRGERGPDAPFDENLTMSGREPHDDTRTMDAPRDDAPRDDAPRDDASRDDASRDADVPGDDASRDDVPRDDASRQDPPRDDASLRDQPRDEPLPGERRDANSLGADSSGDGTLSEQPPKAEERTIPPPPPAEPR